MEFIEQFLEMLVAERGIAHNSVVSYQNDLLGFHKFLLINHLSPLNVQTDDIRNWIEYLAKNGISPRSINRKISSIKNYYEFLISEKYAKYNPCLLVDRSTEISSYSTFRSINR